MSNLEKINPMMDDLNTVGDVVRWFAWMAEHGGVPHPDDRAFQTCDEIRRLGFPHQGDHPAGHVSIVGPLFNGLPHDYAMAYDRAMGRALETLDKARIDPYRLAMTLDDRPGWIGGLRVSPPGARRIFPFEAFISAVTCSLCGCNHGEDAASPNPVSSESCPDQGCPCHDEAL